MDCVSDKLANVLQFFNVLGANCSLHTIFLFKKVSISDIVNHFIFDVFTLLHFFLAFFAGSMKVPCDSSLISPKKSFCSPKDLIVY